MKFFISQEKVRLKDGVLSHLAIREWELHENQGGIALLTNAKVKYTLGVKEDYIEREEDNGKEKAKN